MMVVLSHGKATHREGKVALMRQPCKLSAKGPIKMEARLNEGYYVSKRVAWPSHVPE